MQTLLKVLFSASVFFIVSCAGLNPGKEKEKARLLLQFATEQFNQRDYGKAIETVRESIEADPGFAPAYNHLALIYLETKRYDKAQESFEKALEIQPQYPEVMNNLGVLFNRREKYRQAIGYFDKAIADEKYLTPENAYTNKGYAYFHLGEYDKAIESHQKALDIAPMFCLAGKNMGDVFAKKKNFSKAAYFFEKATTHCPLYQEAQYKLGLVLMRLGQKQVAKAQLEKLVERHKTGPFVERSAQVLKLLK